MKAPIDKFQMTNNIQLAKLQFSKQPVNILHYWLLIIEIYLDFAI